MKMLGRAKTPGEPEKPTSACEEGEQKEGDQKEGEQKEGEQKEGDDPPDPLWTTLGYVALPIMRGCVAALQTGFSKYGFSSIRSSITWNPVRDAKHFLFISKHVIPPNAPLFGQNLACAIFFQLPVFSVATARSASKQKVDVRIVESLIPDFGKCDCTRIPAVRLGVVLTVERGDESEATYEGLIDVLLPPFTRDIDASYERSKLIVE